MELDIEQLSNDAVSKLYDIIIKAFPHLKVKEPKKKDVQTSNAAAAGDSEKMGRASKSATKPKKHKPMGKAEQERSIEKLRELKAQFQRNGSGSQEPLPSVEGQGNSAPLADENDSDDSEEVDSEED